MGLKIPATKKYSVDIPIDRTVRSVNYLDDRIVLYFDRDCYRWPKILRANWIAMEPDGTWIAYEYEPRCTSTGWEERAGNAWVIDKAMLDIELPRVESWEYSKRQRPARVD